MFAYRLIIIFLLLSLTVPGSSQNLSNKGKEFWVGYGHHQFFENGSNTQQMVLYLSAEQAASVTVSINGTSYAQTYFVAANSVISTLPLPKSGPDDCRLFSGASGFTGLLSEGFSTKGIHIVSDVPIVAYAHIFGNQSSGATMLMPTETWGYSYTSVNSKQAYSANCFSWMFVIAKENNTAVQITPSGPTRGGKLPGTPFVITLNKGQVYQTLGAYIANQEGYELTGTTIKSVANSNGECFPIAVFSGSSRTWNPANCGSGGGDNDIQQLFPSQAWGKRYLTAPTSMSSSASSSQTNTFKILIKDPSTIVRRNGVPLTGLIANTYYQFESNSADYLTADQPIMVAQFMTGGTCSGGNGNVGDPEMIYISPIEQGIKRIGFYRNNQQAISVNYLTLIIPSAGVNSLTIDGSASFTYSYDHPSLAGYSVVVKRWTAAQAQCIVQSDSAFTAITYGLGSVESYGYNAGTLINNLNVIGQVHNTWDSSHPSHLYTCRNTPVQISMLIDYKPFNMVWNISQLPMLFPHSDVSVSNPEPVDSLVQNGTKFYKYTLPGQYTFNDTGNFQVPVRITHYSIDNCNNTEIVRFSILVKASPVTTLSFEHSGCLLDTVHFSASTQDNIFTINRWNWFFPDTTHSSLPNPLKVFKATGKQSVRLQIITKEGCVTDTSLAITIYPKPITSFTASTWNICEGSSVQFSDSSYFEGTKKVEAWYWDFGSHTFITSNDDHPQSVIFPSYGDFTVKHLAGVSNTCISDTFSRIIHVFARPNLNFSFSAGCLPTNGVVPFNNTTSIADGQEMNYLWNFGDGQASASNPNTSWFQSPSHIYSVGSYSLQYSAQTINGCKSDTTFTTSFNVRPMLSFPELPSVCESFSGSMSVAFATVTNGVMGSGYYKGPGTDLHGQFLPAMAGPGIHSVGFIFSSSAGCRDSVVSLIKVLPKPLADFEMTPGVCANQLAFITDKSNLSQGKIIKWNWNFGDGTNMALLNNNSFSKKFTTSGHLGIQLVAVSDSNCTSDTVTHIIHVHTNPVTNFTLPEAVCMPDGVAAFIYTSVNPDMDPLSYQWQFGDQTNSSSVQHPSHIYALPGSYQVHLTTRSSFGCSSDTMKTLLSFFTKPIAKFSVTPDTVCQGMNHLFTDLSNSPNGLIQSWNWNFGDGLSSHAVNPVKNYSHAGTYTVALTVKSQYGCISDPFTTPVTVHLQPVIHAGKSFLVPEGSVIHFSSTANDSSRLSFQWTPAGDFSNSTLLKPYLVATHNQVYLLTAKSAGNCTATDTLGVKILKPIQVLNSFSPNGDGVNDTWQIPYLADYPGCRVEVYNRYGQMVYQSTGYSIPWNGSFKGVILPFATYYYVITLKNGFAPLTGSLTIVK